MLSRTAVDYRSTEMAAALDWPSRHALEAHVSPQGNGEAPTLPLFLPFPCIESLRSGACRQAAESARRNEFRERAFWFPEEPWRARVKRTRRASWRTN